MFGSISSSSLMNLRIFSLGRLQTRECAVEAQALNGPRKPISAHLEVVRYSFGSVSPRKWAANSSIRSSAATSASSGRTMVSSKRRIDSMVSGTCFSEGSRLRTRFLRGARSGASTILRARRSRFFCAL
ncbi:hypothetical protein BBBOND_0211530 [Babesia bigemina]|uniref:Uncharacterized protein n=1 Tax=Babesia bigemina TaxID=5866 RepID=A0A061DAR5_BABBI|nr:hypothetical protein BBBOND_0211530 [Babesia bigemina]CDR96009.1 hypothetical protein BBBOND_0211530 [Babesia bigemina]|eukprot:XP_012768195.1 hypothetical protein BBBOND_0211530 [Babesia bigemina]